MRKAIAAELNILESIGRIRSGAVIRPDEYFRIRSELFPVSGDSPEVVRQKMGQLNAALAALKITAGRAASDVPKPETLLPPLPQTPKPTANESANAKRLREIQERINRIRQKK